MQKCIFPVKETESFISSYSSFKVCFVCVTSANHFLNHRVALTSPALSTPGEPAAEAALLGETTFSFGKRRQNLTATIVMKH